MLLAVTKIKFEAYSQNCLGYDVTFLTTCPYSAGVDHKGIGLLKRERPVRWGIESTRYHGPNVVIYKMVP